MIPVYEPFLGEEEIHAVVQALRRGEISGSFGDEIPGFEREFAAYCGRKYGVAVSSGTTALHLAVAAAGVKPGDEILVSASTNIATALAAYHNGAVPVPVDSEPITWNLDLELLETLITSRTRAIIPVHLFGHPVDMFRLGEIAKRHNLLVIEDCAEAHGAKFRGRMAGSFGDMACFSFYANKIITTGEGGMILTDDAGLADRLRLLRNLAFTQPRFKHEAAGFNFRMTGYQAAMGRAQLEKIDRIIALKREVAAQYSERMGSIPGIQTPTELPDAFHVYWMYGIVVTRRFGMTRDELVDHLKGKGIETRTFFCPMNQQPFLRAQPGYRQVSCPVADQLWEDGLYLPSSPKLSAADIASVCDAVEEAARLSAAAVK